MFGDLLGKGELPPTYFSGQLRSGYGVDITVILPTTPPQIPGGPDMSSPSLLPVSCRLPQSVSWERSRSGTPSILFSRCLYES